jgi:hypothetical protein
MPATGHPAFRRDLLTDEQRKAHDTLVARIRRAKTLLEKLFDIEFDNRASFSNGRRAGSA